MTNSSPQLKSQSNLMYAQEHLEDGLKKEKLGTSDPMEENEFISSKTLEKSLELQNSKQSSKQFVTPELVLATRKQISKDKLSCSSRITQMPESQKTLDLVSIGKDLDLDPFWNKHTQEMSEKLWLPTKTGCAGSGSSLLNGYLQKETLSSWFCVEMKNIHETQLQNSQKTFLPSLQCLLQRTMDSELQNIGEKEKLKKERRNARLLKMELKLQEIIAKETPDQTALREKKYRNKQEMELAKQQRNKIPAQSAIKIRIFPNQEQKETLKKWFGVSRWIYNTCLNKVNTGVSPDRSALRKEVVNDCNFKDANTWMEMGSYKLRENAMIDLINNIKSNKAKETHFKIRFKSRKDPIMSIAVLSKSWNSGGYYKSIFNNKTMKSSEPLPDNLEYTSRLMRTQLGEYYLCIPRPLGPVSQNLTSKMAFIDPGSRNFLTIYDPSGEIVTLGKGNTRINKLLRKKEKIQSLAKKSKSKRRSRLKKKMLGIGNKIYNLVSDMHKKIAKWMCETYSDIYIPRLDFHKCKGMYKKAKATLASLRHCDFLNRLVNKTRQYPNCKVTEVNEAFTSKTCGVCGTLNTTLKNKKIFKCSDCSSVLDRDANAARNVMLRYFSKTIKLNLNQETF